MNSIKEITKQFKETLLDLNKIEAQQLLAKAKNDLDPFEIVNEVVVPVLEQIGNEWHDGSLALSQIYMSGRICEQLIDELLPPSSNQRKNQPKMAIAVLNDYHFLGKRIVYSQIRSAGFEIKDYGRKTVDELVDSIYEDRIEVIFISTLMYPSALDIKQVKEKLAKDARSVKILVGGAPFNMDEKLWQEVGADAMGYDGSEALIWIKNNMGDI